MEQLLMALKGMMDMGKTANPMQSTGAPPFKLGDALSGMSQGLNTASGSNVQPAQHNTGLPTGLANAAVNLPRTSYGQSQNQQPALLAILKQLGITP